MKISLVLFVFIVTSSMAQIPGKDEQIAASLLAAPEQFREDATVLGYNSDGKLVTLKKGTNGMICLADDPSKEGFNAAA